jgi:hypothetical protein
MLLIIVVAAIVAFLVFYALHARLRNDQTARIVVALVVFLAVAGTGRAVMKPRLEEAARMEIPFYRALKQHEPQMYDEMKETGTNQLALLVGVRKHTASLISKYAPSASEESLHRFLLISTEVMEAMAGQNPNDTYGAFVPGGKLNVSNIHLPEDVVRRELDALAGIVDSGAGRPAQPLDVAAADAALARAADRIYRGNGDAVGVLARPDAPDADRSRGMRMVAAYYRSVLNLPPSERGMAERRLLTKPPESAF